MIQLKGAEFIRKVMNGERDFTGIKLTDMDVSQHQYDTFVALNEYLQKQDLSQEPIILNESELNSIKAGGLWLPYVKANNISLRESYFPLANFRCGEFPRASFYKTDLSGANCEACDFYNAYFKDADLNRTRLSGARFKFSDLAESKGLDQAHELAYAHFERTHVTSKEKEIILKALRSKEDFQRLDQDKLFRSAPTKPPQ